MKYKIAIIAGGDSGEYEISIKSAGVVNNTSTAQNSNVSLSLSGGKNGFAKILTGRTSR
jgi:D-alanine-D-alanine ligase-like ATP-grasp enzyme